MKNQNDDDLINIIVDAYNRRRKNYQSNKKNVVNHKISTIEIIQMLHTLQLYEKPQNEKKIKIS